MANLILVLGDQLSKNLSALEAGDKSADRVLMCEVREEATYVKHHKKKIALIFSAMRHFAEALREDGWTVDYVKLDDPENSGSFSGEVERAIEKVQPDRLIVTEPGEWRVMEMMKAWREELDVTVEILDDDRFIATHGEFEAWAEGRKQLRMEYFYRDMRKKTGLLVDDDDKPEGGEWNYDSENRKAADPDMDFPEIKRFEPDEITKDVIKLVGERFDDHFGELEPFWFAVTADQANEVLDHFLEHALERFGDYQDAMLTGERFLFHSLLSPYINCGLLDPLKVCQRIEKARSEERV